MNNTIATEKQIAYIGTLIADHLKVASAKHFSGDHTYKAGWIAGILSSNANRSFGHRYFLDNHAANCEILADKMLAKLEGAFESSKNTLGKNEASFVIECLKNGETKSIIFAAATMMNGKIVKAAGTDRQIFLPNYRKTMAEMFTTEELEAINA